MSHPQAPSRRITEAVTSWPGVKADPGRRGGFEFTVGRREIGHLHGDRVAHFGFPPEVEFEQSVGKTDTYTIQVGQRCS